MNLPGMYIALLGEYIMLSLILYLIWLFDGEDNFFILINDWVSLDIIEDKENRFSRMDVLEAFISNLFCVIMNIAFIPTVLMVWITLFIKNFFIRKGYKKND